MTGNGLDIFEADTPYGDFKSICPAKNPRGKTVNDWADPMLFADDDKCVYAYWGLGDHGIFSAEMDKGNLSQLISEPKKPFAYNPDHIWERIGDFHEDSSLSYCEGAWMFKHKGVYYLTYAAPGTEWITYGMSCYISRKPLGPFKYQKHNPILYDTHGLVHGPGHGSIVKGPNNTT